MHEGHRRRMYEKLANGDNLFEHEILEILLYNALPRVNTNPIAHALLDSFGSLSGVFSASPEELQLVEGVGENTALYLKVVAETNKLVNSDFGGITVLKHYYDFKKFITLRMRGKLKEVLEVYCLEKNGRVDRIFTFTSNEVNRVEIQKKQLTAVIAASNPYGLLIAHNHLRGSCEPSDNDDKFTREAQAICSLNGVCLTDHCIYSASGEVYSYFSSGVIDEIKRNYTFDGLIVRQMKKEAEEKNGNKIN